MSAALNTNWKDTLAAALQARPLPEASSFTVSVQISGVTAEGSTTADWKAEGGSLVASETHSDPEVVIALAGKEAVQVVEGTLPLAVAFMRGKAKINGNNAAMLQLLHASSPAPTNSPS